MSPLIFQIKYLDKNIFDLINHDLINYYTTPGEIINLINFSKDKNIDLKRLYIN